MAIYPGATFRPLSEQYAPHTALTVYNRVNLHVAVSEGTSLFGYFNGPNKPSSHFYVAKDGSVEQYQDTAFRAEADLEGNDATISIETQGGVFDAQNEKWTEAQVQSLAKLFAWAVTTHGIANKIATDSVIGDTSKGLSWHRLGIDPWRVANGMHYSTSRGKICPGDAKIAQVPEIFALAQTFLGTVPVSNPVVVAPSTPVQHRDITALQRAVRTAPDNIWGPDTDKRINAVRSASNYGGVKFPWGVKFTQQVVGATADGIWGPKSRAAHDTTTKAVQSAVGATADGVWGPKTQAAVDTAHNASNHTV